MRRIHVIPVGDIDAHYGQEICWCYPLERPSQPNLFVHNAKDCREAYERLTGRKLRHGWIFVYEEVPFPEPTDLKIEKIAGG